MNWTTFWFLLMGTVALIGCERPVPSIHDLDCIADVSEVKRAKAYCLEPRRWIRSEDNGDLRVLAAACRFYEKWVQECGNSYLTIDLRSFEERIP